MYKSFQIEAGDVILKVNGTDVHRYSTKEGKYLKPQRMILSQKLVVRGP